MYMECFYIKNGKNKVVVRKSRKNGEAKTNNGKDLRINYRKTKTGPQIDTKSTIIP